VTVAQILQVGLHRCFLCYDQFNSVV